MNGMPLNTAASTTATAALLLQHACKQSSVVMSAGRRLRGGACSGWGINSPSAPPTPSKQSGVVV
jgi:hypothetical protein